MLKDEECERRFRVIASSAVLNQVAKSHLDALVSCRIGVLTKRLLPWIACYTRRDFSQSLICLQFVF